MRGERRAEVLRLHGEGKSYREIMKLTGLKSPSAVQHYVVGIHNHRLDKKNQCVGCGKRFVEGVVEIEKLRELVGVQGTNGNWNYDPYMQGMYNGMECMLACLEGSEPNYKKAPAEWLCEDRPTPKSVVEAL